MASKKTLNAINLEALGAKRLSELLIEITTGDAEGKRRLRLELADAQGGEAIASEVRKRLSTIARSTSFVEWDKVGKLFKDLALQRSMIAGKVAERNPDEALELMWRFMDIAESVFERSDDGSGRLIGVFQDAVEDLGEIALKVKTDPKSLATKVSQALDHNGYGQYDGLIYAIAPALGNTGLAHLKTLLLEKKGHKFSRYALLDVADAMGDVDAFIEQQTEETKKVPMIAAQIASRLLSAGRIEEAWEAIITPNEERQGWIPVEWEHAKIAVLEAMGKKDEAQDYRWQCFKQSLNQSHLRSYLENLPDFEGDEDEEFAIQHALSFPDVHQALHFLITWPSCDKAAELILNRTDEIDGNHYELLTPAASELEENHPLASTLLRRALINFALVKKRSTRYKHAARHLTECENLAGYISDFGKHETHEHYLCRLKSEHKRKSTFWSLAEMDPS